MTSWPPVDLGWLPRSGMPPWPACASIEDQLLAVIPWLRGRPGLTVIEGPWGPGLVRDARQRMAQGERVLWVVASGALPSAADLAEWEGAPVKLVLPTATPPCAPGWWVAATGDAGELSAILAHHLRDEFSVAVGVGAAVPGADPWPGGQAWEPGQGRWLRRGVGEPRVCEASTATMALAAPGPVFQSTSLAPRARCP